MNFKKITILLLVLLVADQALKIWIKTHMTLDEAIMVVPSTNSSNRVVPAKKSRQNLRGGDFAYLCAHKQFS